MIHVRFFYLHNSKWISPSVINEVVWIWIALIRLRYIHSKVLMQQCAFVAVMSPSDKSSLTFRTSFSGRTGADGRTWSSASSARWRRCSPPRRRCCPGPASDSCGTWRHSGCVTASQSTATGGENSAERRRPSLVVAVTVRHGEDVAVEDAVLDVEGRDGVFALVVLTATFVRLWKNSCEGSAKHSERGVEWVQQSDPGLSSSLMKLLCFHTTSFTHLENIML